MELSRTETQRALWLQRRLKLLRIWNRVGAIICWPWTFYRDTEKRWRDELQILYNKKFLMKDHDGCVRRTTGSPLDRERARQEAREVNEVLDRFQSLYGGKKV